MNEQRAKSLRHVEVAELEARMRWGGPPSDDDVTILNDGTRLDTREKTLEWIESVREARRGDLEQ